MRDLPDIETPRLTLRALAPEHAAALHDVFSNAEAMRFWHTARHERLEDTQAMVDGMVAGPERVWVLIPKGASSAIGLIYFLGEPRLGSAGFGYILHPRHWRKGLMSEAVRALLDHAFDHWDLDRVELWIDSQNLASQGVARRAGFTPHGTFRHKYPHCTESHVTIVLGLHIEQWRPGVAPRQRSPVEAYRVAPVLNVEDVRATAEFYRDKLGFSIAFMIGEPATHGVVALGNWPIVDAQIHLARADAPAAPADVTLYLFVGPGLDALCGSYRSKGVTIVEEPATKPWGMREFAVADCNGCVLRFGTPA